jgi:DNA-binding transcriptional LysR family regulator
MDLRHLRYFVMIAETRHFTRAAEQLGISQPPLSIQIRQLEEEIGHPLFNRSRAGVELTDAGRALLPQARSLLAAASESLEIARRGARGEIGELRLGLSGSTPFHPAIPDLIRRFRARYPAIGIQVRETQSAALMDDLLHDRLDIALVLEPLDAGPELKMRELLTMPLAIALSQDHPLAESEVISLPQLSLEPFVLLPRSLGPGWHDLVTSACRDAGFSPRIVQECARTTSAVHFVAAGLGVTLIPGWLRAMPVPGVVYRDIADPTPSAQIMLVHGSRRMSTPARNLLAMVAMHPA